MKRIAILLVFLSVLYAGYAQDTVIPWESPRYLAITPEGDGWGPHAGPQWTGGMDYSILGYGFYAPYETLYGIAIPLASAGWDCPNHRTEIIFDRDPLAGRRDNLQVQAMLIRLRNRTVQRIDSVHWHYRSHIDRVWCTPSPQYPWIEYWNVHEFYFDNPIQMTDSFFVCIKFGGERIEEPCTDITDSMYYHYNIIVHYVDFTKPQYVQSIYAYNSRGGDTIFYDTIDSPYDLYAHLSILPIIQPPDTDNIVCVPPVLRYRGSMGLYPVFAWEAAGDEEQVECEMQYSLYNREDWTSRMLTSGPNLIRDEFDPTKYYKARARAKCHHGCAVHDTLVWGRWSNPIRFYVGTTEPDTTVGINPMEDAASLFTLTPNPTTGTVRVDWGGHTPVGHTPSPLRGTPPILGGELIVHDAAGHEVMRMKVETGQKAVELDLAALPKGTYFVTLTTPQATGTQRLVLQ